ncbi:hypothetical protein B0T19DRAFT_199633 [Cercophora scortea]|uniref:Azaphilone pigments biosynthesis cluster protein L N-terminal domain-containing protein n=1 Tax=Cercophora scortea TaxID=314031 RepID=A0AAE0IFA6_9PEZI|nr:hypothetical protein B0T19DRAFT_199633 [Cercophora scortea]
MHLSLNENKGIVHWPPATRCVEAVSRRGSVGTSRLRHDLRVIDLHPSVLRLREANRHTLPPFLQSSSHISTMAEIFALATGAISVAGFAGQLARSAAFLQDFIRDIRHAPDDVRKLGEELKALQAILDNIHTSNPTPHADLELALEQNATRLKELTDVANAAKSRLQGKKPALCSQFRVALGRSDVSKYLGELERSKSLLVQACLNASRNHETANSTLLRGLETSMTGLYSGQQAVNSIAANIRTVVDRIQTDSSSLMSTSTQVFELTTETHSNTSKLIHSTEQIHRSVEKLEATTHALIEKTLGQQSRLAEVMQGELNRKLSKTLKRHLRQHRRSQRDSPQGVGGSLHGGMNTAAEHNASQGPREGFHDPTTQATPLQNTGRFSQSAHRVNRWVKNSSTTTQYLNLIVGTIKILTSTTSYAQKSDEGSSVEQMQTSTTLVSFVPAPWLTRRGVVFQCKSTQFVSSTGQTCNPHWGLSAVKIIPYDSEIFEACWCFDLPTVRRLFDEGQASPYDVDKNGRSLLAWTVFAVQVSMIPARHHQPCSIAFCPDHLSETIRLSSLFCPMPIIDIFESGLTS